MRSPHQIVIAFLYVLSAGGPILAGTHHVDRVLELHPTATSDVAKTSEPPGPGCPSIPGGPGPLPDDDDDGGD